MSEIFSSRYEQDAGKDSLPWKDLSLDEKIKKTAQALQLQATIRLQLPILPYGYSPHQPIPEDYFVKKSEATIQKENEKVCDFFRRLKESSELYVDASAAVVSVEDPNENCQYEMHLESLFALHGTPYSEYRKLYFPERTLSKEFYKITADVFQKDVVITSNADGGFYRPIGFITPDPEFSGVIERKYVYLQEGQFSILEEI